MLLTPHTFVGIAIGTSILNPFVAVPLSFVMHFVGDKVPHWDFYSNTKNEDRLNGWRPLAVMADLAIGIGVGLTFTYYALWGLGETQLALNIFLCGIASVLPDALSTPKIFMGRKVQILSTIDRIQSKMQFQAPLPWGILTQILVVAISVAIVVKNLNLL